MKVKMMQVGPIGTNCYILEDEGEKRAAVIDPGDEAGRILSVLREMDSQVDYILLTHGHYDHTTAVPELHEALPDAKIYIHKADANGTGSRIFPLAGQVKDLLFYDEGDALPLGALTVEVLHTPGHSKGSVTLKVRDVLFTGDTLFAGDCGRTDLPGGSYEEILASLGRLGRLEGNFHVCPGHEQTSTMDREREINRYLREGMGLK
ncbi:MAG: MBL fold metallo-hydrolase [Lawsonibacter sp.]|jgi:hydroxyacylglutathione hydrolase|nr:MBL fold metallo-hydrolase [Lawsonibacter sp.]MCI9027208.1 MBL fold metallo-hydrolase [Lawsonibacter sp.]MCI9654806.1 MBL fold metallo-hydrolase [Lawsonibacter sp.]MDE6897739.1 MBL fold metallo-hydrolase [Lawsonibacter sp.]